MEKPAAHIAAQVPERASGTVTPAAAVGANRRRKRNTTSITSPIVAASVSCMSWTLARMVWVRSVSTEMSRPGWDPLPKFGQQLVDAIDRVDDVGVALLGDDEQDRGILVEPAGRAAVAHARTDGGDVGKADHRCR